MKIPLIAIRLLIVTLVVSACNVPTGSQAPASNQSPPSSSSNPNNPNPSSSNAANNPPTGAQQVTVTGVVWHDACALPTGPMPNPLPAGCISDGFGSAVANGFQEPGEEGIAGVSVSLLDESCKSSVINSTFTDSQGHFSFTVAAPGSYCVLIDPLSPPNDSILIPGRWSFPQVADGVAVYEFALDVNLPTMGSLEFGWDYQFLPISSGGNPADVAVLPVGTSFIVDVPANCRSGPSQTFSVVTSFPSGSTLTLSGRNSDSSWWVVQVSPAQTCWISTATGHTSGDTSGLPVVPAPSVSSSSSSSSSSSTDTTPPYISDAFANVTEAYYMTSACGPTEVLITAEMQDSSGIADAYVQYRFMGESGYVGSWHTTGIFDYGWRDGQYGFKINAGEAEFEFFGENGAVQYQVYAKDNAGNVSSYPDGYLLGVPVYFCP
jgi:hypothetical protein